MWSGPDKVLKLFCLPQIHPVNIREKGLFLMVQYKLSSAYWIKYLALFYTEAE